MVTQYMETGYRLLLNNFLLALNLTISLLFPCTIVASWTYKINNPC